MDERSQGKITIRLTTHEQSAREDIAYWRERTPKERLDIVALLRLEAGKFLVEYPVRFQRVIEVNRRT